MKILESPRFDQLVSALRTETGTLSIDGRLESYSCKMATNDKKLLTQLASQASGDAKNLLALSPPVSAQGISPSRQLSSSSGGTSGEEGSGSFLTDTIQIKTLSYLISTLNIAVDPDYDFSSAKSNEFSRERSLQFVMSDVDSCLTTALAEQYAAIRQDLWTAIDEEIALQDCEIYSYRPEVMSSSDWFTEDGSIWAFNYFFFNKKDKKLVFFTCRGSSMVHAFDSGLGSELGFPFASYADNMDYLDEFCDEY